ncbi:MAG: hypothetical protein PHT12_01780 [Patescibacteria group bacterium]|nr:hypothetical protein [Patescibacteria group bacterium]
MAVYHGCVSPATKHQRQLRNKRVAGVTLMVFGVLMLVIGVLILFI